MEIGKITFDVALFRASNNTMGIFMYEFLFVCLFLFLDHPGWDGGRR